MRPSSIYTRTGDKGETSLVDRSRVPKDSPRVEAYGTVDEANSWVGVARACTTHPVLQSALDFLQHRMYNCSSNMATPEDSETQPPKITEDDVFFLEEAIDHFEEKSGPLTSFVLPGGNQCSAFLHMARAVCRRAERRMVTLASTDNIDPMVMKFINRASDFLFAAARYSNHVRSRDDIKWDLNYQRPQIGEAPEVVEVQSDDGCEGCNS